MASLLSSLIALTRTRGRRASRDVDLEVAKPAPRGLVSVGAAHAAVESSPSAIAPKGGVATLVRPEVVPVPVAGEVPVMIPGASPGRLEASWNQPRSGSTRWRRVEAALIFGIPCTIYLVAGWILVFRYASYEGDAQARLANAFYVLYSRDPHLAAIGFVWNPLPSLSVLPLLPLKAIWPSLGTHAFAGNIMSAVFMAASAYQLYAFFRDLGLRRYLRLVLYAVFVFNPLITYFGANGMSEAIFIFTVVLSIRYLARWLVDDRTIWLVVSASALGLAYLARSEAAFAAFVAALVVVVVSFVRSKSARRERVYKALLDGFIFSLPFAVCFVGWAIVSWVIVGNPFEQFQSVYGTSSQLRVLNQANPSLLTQSQRFDRALHAANALAPALPLFVIAALGAAWRRRDLRVLASLAMAGGILLFAVVAFALGQTLGSFRYYIMAVPLVVILTATIVAAASARPRGVARAPRWTRRSVASIGLRMLFCALVLAAVATGIPSSGYAILHSAVATEEQTHLNYIFKPKRNSVGDNAERYRYRTTTTITQALDSMHLRHGAILVDNFTPCVPFIILSSTRPQQFVISNDEDFQPALTDPVTFHVEYLMASAPDAGYGTLDAVNREYPTLHYGGSGIATFVRSWVLPGCPELSLFKVNGAGPS